MQQQYDIPALIKEAVLKQVPDAKLYLFGSRVKGNVHAESDWDVLVLVSGAKLDLKTKRSITSPLYDIEFDTGELISPNVFAEKDWHGKHSITPFYNHVMNNSREL